MITGLMIKIKKATGKDLAALLEIMAIGSTTDHTDYIKKSVNAGKCLAASISNKVVGFGILEQTFYRQGFIGLLIVNPDCRRRGIATALIHRMELVCPTAKLFTSTNESNIPAQKTYESNGFIRSGYIENLDEGDPEIIYFKCLEVTASAGIP
jgi:ribosomal protein S18 acetylase RimI-like enzyme